MSPRECREIVFHRDKACVLAVLTHHECRDVWGDAHRSDDLERLTLGHVREHPGGWRRTEPGWTIAQCGRSNDRHEESANADLVRAYLLGWRIGAGIERA